MTTHDLAGSIQYLGASPTAGNATITLLLALGGLADEEADQEIGDAADAGADLLGASSGVKLVTGGVGGDGY